MTKHRLVNHSSDIHLVTFQRYFDRRLLFYFGSTGSAHSNGHPTIVANGDGNYPPCGSGHNWSLSLLAPYVETVSEAASGAQGFCSMGREWV